MSEHAFFQVGRSIAEPAQPALRSCNSNMKFLASLFDLPLMAIDVVVIVHDEPARQLPLEFRAEGVCSTFE